MKSFFAFNEDSNSAKQESDDREKRSKEFTQQMKNKLISRQKSAIKKFIDQKKKAKKFKEQQQIQKELAAKKSEETAKNLSNLTSGTYNISKKAIKKIRNTIKKRNST